MLGMYEEASMSEGVSVEIILHLFLDLLINVRHTM